MSNIFTKKATFSMKNILFLRIFIELADNGGQNPTF